MNDREKVKLALNLGQNIVKGMLASQTRERRDIDDERKSHIKELKTYGQKIQDGIDALERL